MLRHEKSNFAVSNENSLLKVSNDYEAFLENRKFTDVIFIVGTKKFKAHKYILAARSPVFAAMFEHDCIEKKESKVDIIDISERAFEQFLRYIYTAKKPDLDQFASELFTATDKVC